MMRPFCLPLRRVHFVASSDAECQIADGRSPRLPGAAGLGGTLPEVAVGSMPFALPVSDGEGLRVFRANP